MSAVSWQEPVAPERAVPGSEAASSRDPRLRYWRDVLAAAVEIALRQYQTVWSLPDGDDATRAVSAIGLLHEPATEPWPLELPDSGRLAELVRRTAIPPSDEAVLAAAWWSALDPQMAVAFGCVHDDRSRRVPSLGMLHALLARYGVDVPLAIPLGHRLVSAGLMEPVPDAAASVCLPATTAALLAGVRGVVPGAGVPPRLDHTANRIAGLIEAGACVLVRCAVPGDRAALRDAVAAALSLPVAPTPRPANVARLLHRMAQELPAVLLEPGEAAPAAAVLAFAGPAAAPSAGWQVVDVPAPEVAEAELCWLRALRKAGILADNADAAELAGRIPLSEADIDDIVQRAGLAAAADGEPTRLRHVRAALRAHARYETTGLARRLEPATRLHDLVLSPRSRDGLQRLVDHARFSAAAAARIGVTGSRGRAVIALFAGPSGTGKTAAAEAVAAELDRDLWVVDLAKVVSKWLGETQRNLDLVLDEAAAAGALLLFDEADGLFGKRGEVSDARDRYANMEIDHLLQRIELHTGVVVLTSNRPTSLDEAFSRRIRLAVRFDMPDHHERAAIWHRYLPPDLLDDDVRTEQAACHELSGAAIRSAALSATVAALAERTRVTAQHLDVAVHHELAKANRPSAVVGAGR